MNEFPIAQGTGPMCEVSALMGASQRTELLPVSRWLALSTETGSLFLAHSPAPRPPHKAYGGHL